MNKKRFKVISFLAIVCLIGLVAIVWLVDSYDPEGKEVDARKQRIRELVPIGMDIDAAIQLLRSEGFSVGEKYFPTNDRDCYWVDIILRKEPITFLDMIKQGMGRGRVKKRYMALEADLDGAITKNY